MEIDINVLRHILDATADYSQNKGLLFNQRKKNKESRMQQMALIEDEC
jgi:hypothetical protein